MLSKTNPDRYRRIFIVLAIVMKNIIILDAIKEILVKANDGLHRLLFLLNLFFSLLAFPLCDFSHNDFLNGCVQYHGVNRGVPIFNNVVYVVDVYSVGDSIIDRCLYQIQLV